MRNRRRTVPLDGSKIAGLRLGLPMTQQELAKVAGIAKNTLASIEAVERAEVFPSTVRKLAEALKVEPSDLMLREAKAS